MTWVRHYKKKKSTARSVIIKKQKRERMAKISEKAAASMKSKKEKTSEIPPEKYFVLRSGKSIKSVEELALMLDAISDDDFSFHVNEEKNDFARWIDDVFGKKDLAECLQPLKDKKESQIALLKHTVSVKHSGKSLS